MRALFLSVLSVVVPMFIWQLRAWFEDRKARQQRGRGERDNRPAD